jgi:NIPSNAP
MNRTSFPREVLRDETCSPIVELRQYTLHPGQRDVLIELFDREFIETQEAVGMKVIGQFRDLDNPDRFVWLRGYQDMPSRAEGLSSFYEGPVWKAHRKAANATMVDSDNVLLLRPARKGSGFALDNSVRPPPDSRDIPEGIITATIYALNVPGEEFVSFFERTVEPVLIDAGIPVLACFITEDSPNNYPALPVREGEQVFVWFAAFQDERAYADYEAGLAASPEWRGEVARALALRTKGSPQVLRLSPTARSQLRA